MGLHVVVSDGNKNAPGFAFADDKIIASTYDIELTVKKSKDYNDHRKIDGVICMASDVPLTAATVANELSIPGITIESAMLSSDKIAMKDKFFSDNVSIPKYKELYNIDDLKATIHSWKFPMIIKPVDSRGARGVARLDNNTDINWAWSFAKENSPTDRVMVEEYLEGPQVSTESLIKMNIMFYRLVFLSGIALCYLCVSITANAQPNSFADLAEELSPSVVNITTSTTIAGVTDQARPQIPEGSPFAAKPPQRRHRPISQRSLDRAVSDQPRQRQIRSPSTDWLGRSAPSSRQSARAIQGALGQRNDQSSRRGNPASPARHGRTP